MIIYKCTNKTNGKIYIGKTIGKLKDRVSQHKSESKTYKDYTLSAFHNALNKYGFENFSWEVIDTAETEEELNQKEIYWIDRLQSLVKYNKGYNINTGGEGKDNFSNHPEKETIRKKVGEGVKKSKRWTEERRKEASDFFKTNNPMKLHPEHSLFVTNNPMKREEYKRKGKDNPMANPEFRKKQKERVNCPEVRERRSKSLSLAMKGKKKSLNHSLNLAKVKSTFYWAKYDKETKQLLGVYESFKETGQPYNLCNPYPNALQRGYKIIGDFIWINYSKNEISKKDIPAVFGKGL